MSTVVRGLGDGQIHGRERQRAAMHLDTQRGSSMGRVTVILARGSVQQAA
jgi:hypothetical protein